MRARVMTCLETADLDVVFQPIIRTRDGTVAGLEVLARFRDGRSPAVWFRDAASVGLSVELEILAIQAALRAVTSMPKGIYLALNVSAVTAVGSALMEVLEAVDLALVLELTEHDEVADYAALSAALRPLRARGVRLAADDTGSGYSGLTRLLQLSPDIIKLDRDLIQRVDADPSKRALASAVADFAHQIGAVVVAEGVETEDELRVLTGVGVEFIQGFYLARPTPFPGVLPLFPSLRARTVLIVDDDPIVRSVLRLALEKGGFHVVGEAVDGGDGVSQGRATRPDIILLDLAMPRTSGTEALPALREILPHAAIVVLSAMDPDPGIERLVDGYVNKTIAVTDIADLLDGILRNPRVVARMAPS